MGDIVFIVCIDTLLCVPFCVPLQLDFSLSLVVNAYTSPSNAKGTKWRQSL